MAECSRNPCGRYRDVGIGTVLKKVADVPTTTRIAGSGVNHERFVAVTSAFVHLHSHAYRTFIYIYIYICIILPTQRHTYTYTLVTNFYVTFSLSNLAKNSFSTINDLFPTSCPFSQVFARALVPHLFDPLAGFRFHRRCELLKVSRQSLNRRFVDDCRRVPSGRQVHALVDGNLSSDRSEDA